MNLFFRFKKKTPNAITTITTTTTTTTIAKMRTRREILGLTWIIWILSVITGPNATSGKSDYTVNSNIFNPLFLTKFSLDKIGLNLI